MIPIPDRMRHLKVDPNGYAIPYGVVIDRDGKIHFAMNDEHIRRRSVQRDLCSICGTKLLRGRWFVGGPAAAFHTHGAFIDPPMHYECSHYALQVCPYLAAPRWTKEMGVVKAEQAMKGTGFRNALVMMVDHSMDSGRPEGEFFVAICATSQDVLDNFNTKPKRPYVTIEYWKHGRMVERLTGSEMRKRVDLETRMHVAKRPVPDDAETETIHVDTAEQAFAILRTR